MVETRTADTRTHSRAEDGPGWLAGLASVLAQATRVAVRLRPDGLLELSDRGEILGYVDYVDPVYVALVGDCPQFAVEVAQRATLAAAVDDVRRHQGSGESW
ncbi:hypothetical protein ACFPJ4_07255 [Lysinimonas soli]|uniref:Uncharacterized protein n=1 Tax=Lysinimonas soli TaxID=1074233 RepID=A0ABW0NP19_9MICO